MIVRDQLQIKLSFVNCLKILFFKMQIKSTKSSIILNLDCYFLLFPIFCVWYYFVVHDYHFVEDISVCN